MNYQLLPRKSLLIVTVSGVLGILLIVILARKVEAAKADYLSAQATLNSYRSEIWHIQKIDREDLEKRLVRELTRFGNGNELPLVLDQVFKLGAEHRVNIESAIPKNLADEQKSVAGPLDAFQKIHVEIKAKGAYKDLANFMKALKELPKGVAVVDSFDLSNSNQPEQVLGANLHLNLYLKKNPDQNILDLKVDAQLDKSSIVRSRSTEIRRNPFVQNETSDSSTINIEGIIFDPSNPLVLISGNVHREGDVVSGYKIVKIQRNGVSFDKDGKKITMALEKS